MKQVILVNSALTLTEGKLATQVAHASIAGLLSAVPERQHRWLQTGMRKVILSASDAETLVELQRIAGHRGLPAQLIRDEERQENLTGDITCLSIGPAESQEIDSITAEFKSL